MKAIVWTKYGSPDGLQLRDVEKPAPKDNELLIRVAAATVTAGDCEFRSLKIRFLYKLILRLYAGLLRPKRITILGQELAGRVEAVGKDVQRFRPGDQVFGATGLHFGAYAEYVTLPEDLGMTLKPVNMTFDEAAAVPVGGFEALHFLNQVKLQPGQTILINGAGGSIGTFAIQLAKLAGAEVTAVDSAEKLEMLRTLGVDQVIDYAQEDFSKSGQTYDVILDVIGKSSYARSIKSLNENGYYLLANPQALQKTRGRWTALRSSKRVISGTSDHRREDLIFLKELIEAGKLKSVIDRRYPLAETAEAHRYVETGRKQGNVIITVAQLDEA